MMKYSAWHCLRDNVRIILIGSILLLVICGILFWMLIQPSVRWEPEKGIWYCEELHIQLSYEENAETFLVEDGKIIQCACGSDRGANHIELSCQDYATENYYVGEIVFTAEILSLDDNWLTVYHEQSKREYIFSRIG